MSPPLLSLLSTHPDVVLKICAFADAPRPAIDIDGYAAVRALSSTCLAACLLSEFYADRCETDGEAAWKSLDDVAQGASLDGILYAVREARPVVMRAEKLEGEEWSNLVTAFLDLDKIEERLATAATDVDDPLVLACGTPAKLATKPKKKRQKYEVVLDEDCKWGAKGAVVKVPKSEIKPEFLLPTEDTIKKSACGAISGCSFRGTVTEASLKKYRQKLKELEAGIAMRCAVAVTHDDFQKGHGAFKKSCEAASTPARRFALIAGRAEELMKLPTEPIIEGNKSRLAPLVKDIGDVARDVAGAGFIINNVPVSERAQVIIDRAKAELAKQPLDVRRDELVGRRQAANRVPENIHKQRTLFQQIQGRAPAIPTKPSFTRMDAAAHERASNYQQRLWSASEGQPRRNPVASRRFRLPLCPTIDLGHLVDKLRDGLSFLIPTSEIEIPSPEQLVASMEMGASRYPHLYPLAARE